MIYIFKFRFPLLTIILFYIHIDILSIINTLVYYYLIKKIMYDFFSFKWPIYILKKLYSTIKLKANYLTTPCFDQTFDLVANFDSLRFYVIPSEAVQFWTSIASLPKQSTLVSSFDHLITLRAPQIKLLNFWFSYANLRKLYPQDSMWFQVSLWGDQVIAVQDPTGWTGMCHHHSSGSLDATARSFDHLSPHQLNSWYGSINLMKLEPPVVLS